MKAFRRSDKPAGGPLQVAEAELAAKLEALRTVEAQLTEEGGRLIAMEKEVSASLAAAQEEMAAKVSRTNLRAPPALA